jgi:hypothetical protein
MQAFNKHKKSKSGGEKKGRLRNLETWLVKGRLSTNM